MIVNLFIKEFGSGIPVTFLHGYPLDHTIWLEIVPKLTNEARMILPDLRGHGKSPAPDEATTMKEMAEDVLHALDSLGVEKSIIVGHSMGGYVALALARYYPQRLSGMVLIASHVYADSPEKRESRLVSILDIQKNGLAAVISTMPEKLSYNKAVINKCREIITSASSIGAVGVLNAMANRPDSHDILAQLNVPGLIIAGMEDQIVPLSISREMAKLMRSPQLVEIPEAGHMPMLEQPELVAKALNAFIERIR